MTSSQTPARMDSCPPAAVPVAQGVRDTARLTGWRLVAARSVAFPLIAFTIGLSAYALVLSPRLAVPCHDVLNSCLLSPELVAPLARLGFAPTDLALAVVALSCVAIALADGVAAVILWRRSDDAMALLVAVTLVLQSAFLSPLYFALSGVWSAAGALLYNLAAISFLLLLGLFPSGRFVPRWGWLPLLTILPVPFGLVKSGVVVLPLLLGSFLGIIGGQIYRYRSVSTPVQRQQTKWAVAGLILTITVNQLYWQPVGWLATLGAKDSLVTLLWWPDEALMIAILAVCFGVAILRHRLYDIDLIIRRTLVYGALTASVVGIYVLVVGYLGAAFRTGGNLLISLAATGVVAVLFQPLRSWLQHGVNRLMFGERDDPYSVLARLDTRLALAIPAETVLPTIVETVATALKLPYAAIALAPREPTDADPAPAPAADDLAPAAAHGVPPASSPAAPLTRLPLAYGAETVGYLYLTPRPGESGFARTDRHLLDELAAHAGVVVHAVRLTSELQRTRAGLVTAREEERRRLRRDLHDGLGPQLASLTLTLAAARELLARDPARADSLLQELAKHVQGAMSDVRRLVYELRPPALDDLGLVGALREQAARYSRGGLEVRVEADPALAPLPAAVEVAAYRVGLEALANAARHAQAHRCVIRLGLERGLTVEVVDDGVGIAPGAAAGVGLRSMRERAEELGGSCVVELAPGGGTRVCARWPLQEA